MTDPDITLSEEQGIRYLHFGSPWIQGAMRIRRPWDIVIDYVALMQSWLLFLEPPKRVLQIGLGAAALTKHSYRHFGQSEITVVEASGAVCAAARQYFALPENDSRLNVVVRDGADFLGLSDPATDACSTEPASGRRRKAGWGVIQVDVYDQDARGPVLDSEAFYRRCHESLAEPGMFSVNLFGEASSYPRNLARIKEAFEGRVLAWPAVDAGNVVVLGFKGPKLEVSWQALMERATTLEQAYDLPARKWLRSLRNHPAQARTSTTHLSL